MRLIAGTLALCFTCGALTACESTQDRSERIGRQSGGVSQESGVSVKRHNKAVRVVSTDVLQDENGAAVVVNMASRSKSVRTKLPISIDVKGRGGRSVFRNDQPGLEPSLAAVSVLRPGERFAWVNDQVTPSGPMKRALVKVGSGKSAHGRLPSIKLEQVKLRQDPVSGATAVGVAENRSKIEQRKLVIYATARKGRRIVAAGRAQIRRLKPGKRSSFNVFFIGNPRGARLSLSAPPTTFS